MEVNNEVGTMDVHTSDQSTECQTTSKTNDSDVMKCNEKDTTDASDVESEEPPPSPRVTRARNRFIELLDSDTDTDGTSARSLRRRSRQNSISNAKSSPDPKIAKDKKKPRSKETNEEQKKTRVKSRKTSNEKQESNSDDDGEYVHVNVGDCVLLDSGDPDSHYVALVSSVQLPANHKDKIGTFTAQWYYKPDDIRDEVRENIPGGVHPKEVFLSPHKDKNSIDAVIGTCDVYSKEEFDEIQQAEQRGFREKSSRLYFMCRFKYYPNRTPKKALEPLSVESIRGGLGPQKPKIGDTYQADLPKCITKPKTIIQDMVPWKHPKPSIRSEGGSRCKAKQVWSPHVVIAQEGNFRLYRELLNTIRFSVGNIVKMYRPEGKAPGMRRCIILKYIPSDSIQICIPTGEIHSVLPSDVYSPLTDDMALKHFYLSRFNISLAIHACTQEFIVIQQDERLAYTQEIRLFGRIMKDEKNRSLVGEIDVNTRKRRK